MPARDLSMLLFRVARTKIGSKITSFDPTRLMIFTQLWKTITSSSKLQMSPRFRPRLHFNVLYNFCVLAETQFQLLEAQKCMRSRAIDQKLKGAPSGLGSRLHEQ
ncbi:hypothetical protein LguiA_004478 [Lonicera macranthoides]